MKQIKIISWNVNGIRASHTKGALDEIFSLKPDIVVIQETKAHLEQLDDVIVNKEGYLALFHSPLYKKGYSGTAIYSKLPFVSHETSFPAPSQHLDEQGRLLTAHFEDFSVINGYFPNGGGAPEKLVYKLAFYDALLAWQKKFLVKHQKTLILGDLNIAHTEIDLARPKENEKNVGFLPQERAKLDELFVGVGYTDMFRKLHPGVRDAYTYWDQKTRARDRNVGWRIDYALASPALVSHITSCEHLTDIVGSDHCPVLVTLTV